MVSVRSSNLGLRLLTYLALLQDKVVSDFEVSLEKLEKVEASMTAAFKLGLSEEGDHVKVKMLPTFVHSLPSDEEGEFLFVDFGGTNLRVGRISE